MRNIIVASIALILIVGAGFYWFQYRPSSIIKQCQMVYDIEFERIKEVNRKYDLKNGVTLTKEQRITVDNTAGSLWRIDGGMSKKEWNVLPSEMKELFEEQRFKITEAELFRSAANKVYEECLRRNGLSR